MIKPKNLPKISKDTECCGNFRWFNYTGEVTRHAKPRYPRDAGGSCVWPQPFQVLPQSITRAHAFQRAYSRNYCHALDDGRVCPTWEPGENAC